MLELFSYDGRRLLKFSREGRLSEIFMTSTTPCASKKKERENGAFFALMS
jgi:hypothetical protein